MSVTNYLLSREEWSKLYPKLSYEKGEERAKKYTLHYLLALDQPDGTVLHYMTAHKEKALLSDDTPHHSFTPLTIAVIKGKLKVVEKIIDLFKANSTQLSQVLNARDSYGWTPLHHAAASPHRDTYKQLVDAGGDLTVKNRLNGTPNDLLHLAGAVVGKTCLCTTFIKRDDGSLESLDGLTNEQLQEKSGISQWRDTSFFSSEDLFHLWTMEPFSPKVVCFEYPELKARGQAKVILSTCSELAGKSSYPLELCAAEDMPQGTYIGDYVGKYIMDTFFGKERWKDLIKEDHKEYLYLFGNIEASTIGNALRFVNWGFPNMTAFNVSTDGVNKHFFVVTEPSGIKAGEPLLWDYSLNYRSLAFGAQTLFGRDRMRAFFSQGPLKTLFKKGEQLGFSAHKEGVVFAQQLDWLDYDFKLLFPLNAPAALLDLHFSGIVDAEQWLSLLLEQEHRIIVSWIYNNHIDFYYLCSAIVRIVEFDAIAKKHPMLKTEACKWILGSIGSLTFMQLLKSLDEIAGLMASDIAIGNFQKALDGLTNTLQSYDWEKDSDAPLCLRSVSRDVYGWHAERRENASKGSIEEDIRFFKRQIAEMKAYTPENGAAINRELLDIFQQIVDDLENREEATTG